MPGGPFAVVRCAVCGLLRTAPQPEDLGAFYPQGYYSFQPPAPPGRLERARIRSRYGLHVDDGLAYRALAHVAVDRLTPGLPPGPPGHLLDVGCGSGEDLLALSGVGWTGEGVEVSEEAVAAARTAGLTVHHGDLRAAALPDASFDVVRFWHSLEHTRDPRAELIEARRLLRSGGVVVVGVPNAGSALARLARERWFYLDVPRHLWHFELRTMARLLDVTGFTSVRTRLVSTSSALLGTIDFLRGKDGALSSRRAVWMATLPVAATLDLVRVGDALEATGVAA